MSLKKRAQQASRIRKRLNKQKQVERRFLFNDLVGYALPVGTLFSKEQFHGNIKWVPEQLATQALIWSWQDTKTVTDAFEKTLEICANLGLKEIAKTYTAFMNALDHYRQVICEGLRVRRQALAQKIGGKYFRTNKWVLIGFDGSRATAPRSIANEKAFCAPNYGFGTEAKYGKKKSLKIHCFVETQASLAIRYGVRFWRPVETSLCVSGRTSNYLANTQTFKSLMEGMYYVGPRVA